MTAFHTKLVSRLLLTLLICLPGTLSYAQTPCIAASLKCEYLINPLGIDAAHPRITWQLQDTRFNARQTSYQLIVGTDSVAVSKGTGDYWQTGRVASGSQLVTYQGKALQPFTRYYYTVQVWDKFNQTAPLSHVAAFETGMMNSSNWKGAWISDTRDIHLKPAPYFRKGITFNKTIQSARVYIAVAGLYELYINGTKVGDHELDPMYTRFDRRTLYVTHDVTSLLQKGDNAIGVLLGNGWYNHQSTAVWYFHEAPWRQRPAFCMDLRITYTDGSVETVTSGKDWKTSLSPVIFNSIYTGEHYDARLEQPGWNKSGFDDSKWKPVLLRAAPSNNIIAQVLHPIKREELRENQTYASGATNDHWSTDLRQNIAGVSTITASGQAGTVIRVKHAERLDSFGHLDLSNIDVHYRPTDSTDPFATDIYILSGKGKETFTPHFNYKGFQHIEVTSSAPIDLDLSNFHAYVMHSDVPSIGWLYSNNNTIDGIFRAARNSYLSNLFGYPTDCPQREKNGWTGDAHIASEIGLYNFDAITIYEKWMADHQDEQQPNGTLPSIIPTDGWGYEWGNGPDWTSTIAIIPWNIYLFYGDTTLLSRCYDNIKRYVDRITATSVGGLTTWGLGDWVPVKSKTPVELTSSVYYFTDASILAKAAAILNKPQDQATYQALANTIKSAINNKYLNAATGIYGNGAQTELSVPLYWGIVPDSLTAKVAANLAQRVHADGDHIDVGLLGTKAILNALSEHGYADVAYKVASQETYPSWGWWIKNGATTLYENWPIDAKSDISLNHIMFGEIGAWFYKALGGIRPDPEAPGFKNILLEPHFVPGLNECRVTHESPYGEIVSSWKRAGKRLTYQVVIPPNSAATLTLPPLPKQRLYMNGVLQKEYAQRLTAGTYLFEWK